MSIAAILLGVATSVGAPVVKSILEKYVGGTASDIGGTIIDAIAGKAGVKPDELDGLSEKDLGKAIAAVEVDAPALVLAHVEQQRESNKLLLKQMEDGKPTWTWAWLPGWQWFLMFLWFYAWVAVPVVNAAVGSGITPPGISDMIWLTTCYQILHMGGHTGLQLLEKWVKR